MSHLKAISPESSTGKVKDLFGAVQDKLGMVPNMMRVMANSPSVLEGYLQFSGALSHGKLSARTREQLALAVAEANGCEYCLAAHSTIGKKLGLSADQIHESRAGESNDPKTNALIKFALRVVERLGHIDEDDMSAIRAAGFDDATIAEVLAGVALDVFTNYFNIVTEPEVDFPKAPALSAAR
jgi:uncharacterized peroxidase-related enzyme